MYSILLPYDQVENGQRVYKPSGSKLYTVEREVHIYSDSGSTNTLKCENGTVFLISQFNSNINAVNGHKKCRLDFDTIEDLQHFCSQLDSNRIP